MAGKRSSKRRKGDTGELAHDGRDESGFDDNGFDVLGALSVTIESAASPSGERRIVCYECGESWMIVDPAGLKRVKSCARGSHVIGSD